MSRQKNNANRNRKKISSTLLTDIDLKAIGKLMEESGAKEAIILRGLIRVGVVEIEKKKISTLELLRLGAY